MKLRNRENLPCSGSHVVDCDHRKPTKKVLVIGDDMRAFLAIVRSLGRHGLQIDVVPFNQSAPALSSRYITKTHKLHHPAIDVKAWVLELKRLDDLNNYDLIIPACERSMLPLFKHRHLFRKRQIAHPGETSLSHFLDKYKTHQLASAHNVPVSKGGRLSAKDTAEKFIATYDLPLVIRHRFSYQLEKLERRNNVTIIKTRPQLENFLTSVQLLKDFIINSYFPENGRGYGLGLSVLAHYGEICVAFQHRRLTEPQNGGGSSLRISEPIDEDLLHHCSLLAAAANLNGIAMFEFRKSSQENDVILIEVNPRFWGSLPLAIQSGVNFPVMLYEMMVNNFLPEQPNYKIDQRCENFILHIYDLLFRDHRSTRLRNLSRSIFHLITKAFVGRPQKLSYDSFTRDDLMPGFVELITIPRLLLNRLSGRAKNKYDRDNSDVLNEKQTRH